jgi:hypothetical protein
MAGPVKTSSGRRAVVAIPTLFSSGGREPGIRPVRKSNEDIIHENIVMMIDFMNRTLSLHEIGAIGS